MRGLSRRFQCRCAEWSAAQISVDDYARRIDDWLQAQLGCLLDPPRHAQWQLFQSVCPAAIQRCPPHFLQHFAGGAYDKVARQRLQLRILKQSIHARQLTRRQPNHGQRF